MNYSGYNPYQPNVNESGYQGMSMGQTPQMPMTYPMQPAMPMMQPAPMQYPMQPAMPMMQPTPMQYPMQMPMQQVYPQPQVYPSNIVPGTVVIEKTVPIPAPVVVNPVYVPPQPIFGASVGLGLGHGLSHMFGGHHHYDHHHHGGFFWGHGHGHHGHGHHHH